jgi:transposase
MAFWRFWPVRPIWNGCARQHDRARSQPGGRGAQGKRGADAQGLGRSRGGLSTKLHVATEALGLPLRLIASAGQRSDIADKGYDADHLIDAIAKAGAEPVIPPRKHRKTQRSHDADFYKERNRIERFFNKLKQFRRVATRYDKLPANFMGFVKLAAIIWLR